MAGLYWQQPGPRSPVTVPSPLADRYSHEEEEGVEMSSQGNTDADDRTPSASPPLIHSPPASDASADAPRQKRRRSIAVPSNCCRTCRARKVKCPGNQDHGPCANCTRLDLVCSFVENDEGAAEKHQGRVARTTPSRSHTEAGTLRKRAQRACKECHIHKTKCSGDLPQCKRCDASGLVCEYMAAKRKFTNVTYQSTHPSRDGGEGETVDVETTSPSTTSARLEASQTSGTATVQKPTVAQTADTASQPDETRVFGDGLSAENFFLNKAVILKHVDIWFQEIHPLQSYGFFHPSTTYRAIDEGRFPPTLAAGICAVASLVLCPQSDKAGREFADKCNTYLAFHIFLATGRFRTQDLYTLVLSSIYSWGIGESGKAWDYVSRAARLLKSLQLNWDDSQKPFVEQECIRRLVWQVFILDRLGAGGFEDHIVLPETQVTLSLPCEEQAFREGQSSPAQTLQQRPQAARTPTDLPIHAIYCRLMSMRHKILGTTKKYARSPASHPQNNYSTESSAVMEDVQNLQCRLAAIKQYLPECLQLSEANIRARSRSSEWPAFVMIHSWIHVLHLDLYRFALPGRLRERAVPELMFTLPVDFIEQSRKQAVAHAFSISRFWQTVQNLDQRGPTGSSSSGSIAIADHTLTVCVVQATRVLLVALEHQLYFDLREHSTIALWHNEVIDDAAVIGLIESNMAFVDHLCDVFPEGENWVSDLRQTVANLHQDTTAPQAEEPGPLDNVRVRGPHYVLEQILNAQGQRGETPFPGMDASLAEEWLREKRPAPSNDPAPVIDATRPPEIPYILAQARGAGPVTPDMTPSGGDLFDSMMQTPIDPITIIPELAAYGFGGYPLLSPEEPDAPMHISFGNDRAPHAYLDGSHGHGQYQIQAQAPGLLIGSEPTHFNDLGAGTQFIMPYRAF